MHAIGVDDHDLTGLALADDFGADLVERTSLAAEHKAFADRAELRFAVHAAEDQRPEALWIARADQFIACHEQEAVRALDQFQAMSDVVFAAYVFRTRQQVDDDFAVGRSLED